MRSCGSHAGLAKVGLPMWPPQIKWPRRGMPPPPPKEAWGGDPLKQGLPSLHMLGEVFIPTASRVSGLSREVTCLSLEHTAIIMEYSNQTAQRVIMENGFPFW